MGPGWKKLTSSRDAYKIVWRSRKPISATVQRRGAAASCGTSPTTARVALTRRRTELNNEAIRRGKSALNTAAEFRPFRREVQAILPSLYEGEGSGVGFFRGMAFR